MPPSPLTSIWPCVAFIFFSLSTKWMLCYYWDSGKWGCPLLRRWLQSIKWPHPTPPSPAWFSPSLSPFSSPLALCKLVNTQASILPRRHFAITAVLFAFLDCRITGCIQTHASGPASHWPSKACNFAGLFMEWGEHILPTCSSLLLWIRESAEAQRSNPITPPRPCAGAIRALWPLSRRVALNFLLLWWVTKPWVESSTEL